MSVNKLRKEQRRVEALQRQLVAAGRTKEQKLDRLDGEHRRAVRERARIQAAK